MPTDTFAATLLIHIRASEIIAAILAALVGMDDDCPVRLPAPNDDQQRIEHEFSGKAGFHRPTGDLAGIEVEHRRQMELIRFGGRLASQG